VQSSAKAVGFSSLRSRKKLSFWSFSTCKLTPKQGN
jgi:hypothetical protein